ncbi:MAG: hypothetical protein ACI8UO_005048 [Verrucomicrobiales bacterium]|jgi:hypothetical protein
MRSTYNTHVRKLKEIDLSRDAETLTALLAECQGSRVVLRVKQGERKFEVTKSEPDLAATLAEAGVNTEEWFDAEILTRDPVSKGPDVEGAFVDRNDWNALQWNGERGTGHPAPGPPRTTPMFFRENGSAVDVIDLYAHGGNRSLGSAVDRVSEGRPDADRADAVSTERCHPLMTAKSSVFLILNGPSFDERAQQLLENRPGILTFGVNNGAHGFRPDFWTCVDDPSRFVRSIWEDGRIQKFVPMAHFEKRIWDTEREAFSAEKVKDFPNVIGYRRNEAFCPGQWLVEDTINWGNHTKRGGGRSVMLAALRIAWLLGFRRVYLVGCDFEMTSAKRYWFAEQRSEQAIKNNQNSYKQLEEFFAALKPEFERAGFEVVNCNAGSRLKVFPFADLEEAVAGAAVEMSEPTEGMYVDRRKAGKAARIPSD